MRRPTASSLVPLCAASALLVAVACGTSGREMRPPEPNAVQPTRSTTNAGAGALGASSSSSAATGTVQLTSTAFPPAGPIPARHGCDGPSPQLTWSNIPAGTTELALVVIDLDADSYVHWLVTGIPATAGSVAEGATPTGGTARTNSKGTTGWTGPCPPAGTTHTYNFVLFALPQQPTINPGASPVETYQALQLAATGNAALLSGTFRRD